MRGGDIPIQEQRLRLAELLEKVAIGEITSQEAVSRMLGLSELPKNDKVISGAWEHLMHFHADADIRAKEPKYARMQHEGLLTWAQRLRKG